MNARTATQLAMATEECARIETLEDRVTIDDALIGTLRDRIRELEEALREYAQHNSWRCEHPPHYYLVERSGGYVGCPCGLDATLQELGLRGAVDEILAPSPEEA